MSISARENRTTIQRLTSPSLEDFARAAEVCYTRWEYMRELDSEARFRGFQQLGVELCAMVDAAGTMHSVAYLIPAQMEAGGDTLSWYYMFQVASRPSAAGAGALLVRQVMKWYPAIFGIGITPDAERLYQAFRWQPHGGFWRGVHPVNLSRMVQDYGERIPQTWLRYLLRATGGAYNITGRVLETLLGAGARCRAWEPGKTSGKPHALAGYLGLLECGATRAADVGGVGRVLSLPNGGSLREHAAIWRALRKRNAKLCEMLLYSEEARARSKRLGYVPVRLQVWCWDPQGVLARAIPVLRERGFSFLDTDKVV
jgi:hypothetical protein